MALRALLLAAAALAAQCREGQYYLEEEGSCLTREACERQGRQVREAGYCREVHKVSTLEGLKAMADRPYAAFLLTEDITFDDATGPIDFKGELDGQGHWIRNISFDLAAFSAASPSSTVNVGLFPDIVALKNVGLEAAVDLLNNGAHISRLYLGLVTGYTTRLVRLHGVLVNGSVSASSSGADIDEVRMGGLIGYQSASGAFIGPNVTSRCSFNCKASDVCYAGGIAHQLNGVAYRVAVFSESITLDASWAWAGGLAVNSELTDVRESLAELGEVRVAAQTGNAGIGGLVAEQYPGAQFQDCYATIASVSVTPGTLSKATLYLSPFLAAVLDSPGSIAISRCYGWLRGPAEVVTPSEATVNVGGLAAYARQDGLTVSASFAIVEDVRLAASANAYIGGLVGQAYPKTSNNGVPLILEGSWSRLRISSAAATGTARFGGVCGACTMQPGASLLRNLSADLSVTKGVTDAHGEDSIGVLAGWMRNETVSQASQLLLKHTYVEAYCRPVRMLASGAVTISDVYLVQNGGVVTPGSETGTFSVTTGHFGGAAYPGLAPAAWDFHTNGYPTLSTLPAWDWTGARSFAEPSASTWEEATWALPDVKENRPRLVHNHECKAIGGNALCVSCPQGLCTQCEGSAQLVFGGELCLVCPEGFQVDHELGVCVTGACSAGCQKCGEDGLCLECRAEAPLLDLFTEEPRRACLDRGACVSLGAIADLAAAECRAPREFCGGADTPAIPNCARCPEVNEGETVACLECVETHYLNLLPQTSLAECLSREECSSNGGLPSPGADGAPATCPELPCSDPHCLSCSEGSGRCSQCMAGYLLEARGGHVIGECIPEGDCTGTSGKDSTQKACVLLKCASIDRCTACNATNSALCAGCAGGWSPSWQKDECLRDTCLQGPTRVPNCRACEPREDEGEVVDGTECRQCVTGYLVDKREAREGVPASPTLGKCVSAVSCRGTSGPEGLGCVYLECAGITGCAACAAGDGASCAECEAGRLLDVRAEDGGLEASDTLGKCIYASACARTSGKDPTGKKCVRLECAAIPECASCEADGFRCRACREGHVTSPEKTECLSESACTESSTRVEGCAACYPADPRKCARCAWEGFAPNEDGSACVEEPKPPICQIAHCAACADAQTCGECEAEYLLDKRVETAGHPGAPADGRCIARSECAGVAGPDSAGGRTCVYLGCALVEGCTECRPGSEADECQRCGDEAPSSEGTCEGAPPPPCQVEHCRTCADARSCGECASGYLVDDRRAAGSLPASGTLGQCIPASQCTGTSGSSGSSSGRCVRLGCASVDGCAKCSPGDQNLCETCRDTLYLNLVQDFSEQVCLSLELCRAIGGKVEDGNCVSADKEACKGAEPLCKTCLAPDYDACASCGEHLADFRHGGGWQEAEEGVSCVAASECTGLYGPGEGEDYGACVPLGCARDSRCVRCQADDPEQCEECVPPYEAHGGSCRNDCVAGPMAVPHCNECVGQGTDCLGCEKGYVLVTGEDSQVCKKAGLSSGAITGITIAVLVVVGATVGLCVYFLVCRKKKASAAVA